MKHLRRIKNKIENVLRKFIYMNTYIFSIWNYPGAFLLSKMINIMRNKTIILFYLSKWTNWHIYYIT